jgi:hypothetical protein
MSNLILIILYPIIILFIVGVILLQIFLSRRDNKYWGLILPVIFFPLSVVLSIKNFEQSFYISFSEGAFLASLLILILYNTPTIISILIYTHYRKKIGRENQLNKMNIQDLE